MSWDDLIEHKKKGICCFLLQVITEASPLLSPLFNHIYMLSLFQLIVPGG